MNSKRKSDNVFAYNRWIKSWKNKLGYAKTMTQAVGGEFEAFGLLERDLLIQCGLRDDSYVIDVGCGSGRLAKPLSQFAPRGRYLGIDVVPELLAFARQLVDFHGGGPPCLPMGEKKDRPCQAEPKCHLSLREMSLS